MIRTMAKQKKKSKSFQISANVIAQNSFQSYLVEKVNVSNWNPQASAEKKLSQITNVPEKSSEAKKRGRVEEKKWTSSQTMKLYELHDYLGNKWKEIANFFPDRNDNNVKNHFFSRLRLSLRQLNRMISKLLGPKKQIKNHALYKITSICSLKFKKEAHESQNLIEEAISLKKNILNFTQNSPTDQNALELWEIINTFSNKINNNKLKFEHQDVMQSQENKVDFLPTEVISKTQTKQPLQMKNEDTNTLKCIYQDDFVFVRNLTPNERFLLTIPPQFDIQKTQEYVEKPAITLPENLFLSPTHSIDDSVFNLNVSDQSYFSQNQNISFYTDFLNQQRTQKAKL